MKLVFLHWLESYRM